MTLVIGYATKEIGFLIADTLLSSRAPLRGDEGPFNGARHTLKIHILSGRLAVAFAGDPGLASDLIAALKVETDANQNLDVPQCLFEMYRHRATEMPEAKRSDFLILRLLDDGPTLDKVTLEDGIRNAERAYIGDAEGHRQLTRLLGTYAGPKMRMVQQPDGSFITKPFEPMDGEQWFAVASEALEALCHKKSVETVGAVTDAITRVVDARISGELEYLQSAYVGRSIEEGLTGYTVLAANTGTRATAIYFYAGEVGFVFLPGDPAGCRRLAADSDVQFIDAARQRFGIELTGPTQPA
ncbi:hypothetical protein WM29_26375 [Burkholderia ubonensis]|uniref:hypothetical protein n=1 Tax=Burkholderia ubonensis TaxID=101571 RepID=UPI000753D509|nr:hypothetical protein [Burkholderia ubonensis]AOK62599.1 hypothetical protein WM29_26375 [Burkholderia ubonensis]KWN09120.1 hypothetical protein WM21_27150 [Burkholderia ubonensis]